MVCDQVRVSFNAPKPHLQPTLPIMGLGYQWSLDFASPLNLTIWHNQYILIMIEHFSKWLKLAPLPNCSSEKITYAFLDRVLISLVFQVNYSSTNEWNSMGNSKIIMWKNIIVFTMIGTRPTIIVVQQQLKSTYQKKKGFTIEIKIFKWIGVDMDCN